MSTLKKKNCYVWNLDGGFYYKVKIWGCKKLIFFLFRSTRDLFKIFDF